MIETKYEKIGDVATPLLESRDMQYAVDLLLTQGARQFIQNHSGVVFEGR